MTSPATRKRLRTGSRAGVDAIGSAGCSRAGRTPRIRVTDPRWQNAARGRALCTQPAFAVGHQIVDGRTRSLLACDTRTRPLAGRRAPSCISIRAGRLHPARGGPEVAAPTLPAPHEVPLAVTGIPGRTWEVRAAPGPGGARTRQGTRVAGFGFHGGELCTGIHRAPRPRARSSATTACRGVCDPGLMRPAGFRSPGAR